MDLYRKGKSVIVTGGGSNTDRGVVLGFSVNTQLSGRLS